MNKTRTIALLLTAMLVLAGCGTSEETKGAETAADTTGITESTETETEAEETLLTDNVPTDLKFDGVTFQMYSPDQYDGPCMVEEENGEVLNDAKYKMELLTEERLGVAIEETLAPYWDMLASVEQLVTSGDQTYGCVTMMDRFGLTLAQEGCIFPIQNIPYVKPDSEYWGKTITDSLSVNGIRYFGVGSFNLRSFKDTACVLINTTIAEEHGIDIPYTMVEEGTWTFDAMQKLVTGITADVNGDGVMDENDLYGIGTFDRRSIPIINWIAADMRVVDKDQNGTPYLSVYGNEKFISVMEWTRNTFITGSDCMPINESADAATMLPMDSDMFQNGNVFLQVGYFSHIVKMREMEDDFTVLPVPKYDEAQAEYHSRTYDAMVNMVPVTASNLELSGAVLEVLSCNGYNYVVPAFIESSLMQKYSRDAESVKSIRIAFDTRTIDMGEAFMYTLFGNDATFALIKANELNTASWLESIRSQAEKDLAGVVEALGSAE